jgi:hypothetical protein
MSTDHLRGHTDQSDQLLVAELTGVASLARIYDKGRKWLKDKPVASQSRF